MTLDQTVQALASASQALRAAQNDYMTKNGLWESALNAKGLLPARRVGRSGKHSPLPPPPVNPDLNALAAAVVGSKMALQAAQTVYSSAKTAHDAAMAAAGVVASVNLTTASS
jgi:hypothetical protein